MSIVCIGISTIALGSNPPSTKCHFENEHGENVNGRVETYHENYGTDSKRESSTGVRAEVRATLGALGIEVGGGVNSSSERSAEATSYNSGYNEGTRCRNGAQASQNGNYDDGWKQN